MEKKTKKDKKEIKKPDLNPTMKVKGAAFPVRHGKLGTVVTR